MTSMHRIKPQLTDAVADYLADGGTIQRSAADPEPVGVIRGMRARSMSWPAVAKELGITVAQAKAIHRRNIPIARKTINCRTCFIFFFKFRPCY